MNTLPPPAPTFRALLRRLLAWLLNDQSQSGEAAAGQPGFLDQDSVSPVSDDSKTPSKPEQHIRRIGPRGTALIKEFECSATGVFGLFDKSN